ncbi:NADH dehydrogenase [ubiquinone] 1 alpha subcomplex subunit 2 [Trichogramma pretiosum]|uniref:NADH dehydrogenase [ubiquinone] 1 alpha subcomplex subunit 2 n=1 Tax=Trichogramma pretiosum TaxID=7493 RepID=UPI0006C97FFF|nr:NADH dehydrogenase [ubiquinone] 1 alpha subcomplex subunit 2 [Trichogramma pretiosum]
MAAIRLGSKIKELRILLCSQSKSSEGARNFIEENYVNLKQANPNVPILVRECLKIEPRIYVRAEQGKESWLSIGSMSSTDIAQKLQKAASEE